jgi:hypothetical protein
MENFSKRSAFSTRGCLENAQPPSDYCAFVGIHAERTQLSGSKGKSSIDWLGADERFHINSPCATRALKIFARREGGRADVTTEQRN